MVFASEEPPPESRGSLPKAAMPVQSPKLPSMTMLPGAGVGPDGVAVLVRVGVGPVVLVRVRVAVGPVPVVWVGVRVAVGPPTVGVRVRVAVGPDVAVRVAVAAGPPGVAVGLVPPTGGTVNLIAEPPRFAARKNI